MPLERDPAACSSDTEEEHAACQAAKTEHEQRVEWWRKKLQEIFYNVRTGFLSKTVFLQRAKDYAEEHGLLENREEESDGSYKWKWTHLRRLASAFFDD
jgi:hypothetical protein